MTLEEGSDVPSIIWSMAKDLESVITTNRRNRKGSSEIDAETLIQDVKLLREAGHGDRGLVGALQVFRDVYRDKHPSTIRRHLYANGLKKRKPTS
jgi:hypothetical protein